MRGALDWLQDTCSDFVVDCVCYGSSPYGMCGGTRKLEKDGFVRLGDRNKCFSPCAKPKIFLSVRKLK